LDPRELLIDIADKEKINQLPTRDREAWVSFLANRVLTELPYYYFDHDRNFALLL
jgi:hypothetical protein